VTQERKWVRSRGSASVWFM